jgi:endonuclease/exonuclease/phosphatase family metal-dependent hydrolase
VNLKILTLNIHNYHNFKIRKPKIIALIKKYDPDIVALQEVRDDRAKNEEGEDQAKQLNDLLQFKHFIFIRSCELNKAKGLTNLPSKFEGLALLSKFPFSYEEFKLIKQDDDKYNRKVLQSTITIGTQKVPIWIVHFSNSDTFAALHIKETLKHAESIQPIILGDFNIKYPEQIQKLAKENNYISSSDYNYISFPEDNCSYDYIFIPTKFTFSQFECIEEEVSDHKALFANIKL